MILSWCRTMRLAPVRLPSTLGFWNDGNRPRHSLSFNFAQLSGLLPVNAPVLTEPIRPVIEQLGRLVSGHLI
jgi:hypothetical protein